MQHESFVIGRNENGVWWLVFVLVQSTLLHLSAGMRTSTLPLPTAGMCTTTTRMLATSASLLATPATSHHHGVVMAS
jgi:hypothetical protein